jgi:hypothetical protein
MVRGEGMFEQKDYYVIDCDNVHFYNNFGDVEKENGQEKSSFK